MIARLLAKWIDRRIAAYQQRVLAIHAIEVENMYNQMRGWRHDYRNHLATLKALAQNDDREAITRYIDALDADLIAVENTLKTGNKMADAILNSKISLAAAKEITIIADVNVAVELTTSQIDLCIILGNLLDNAVEASTSLPPSERIIRIFMEMKNTQLYISVTNATSAGKIQNGRYASSKGDGHGFGLARIDHIVARYSGYIRRASEDGVFTTEILLPQ
ncbi:MAG: ATP-binding protein [Defluviitaleaceae bacterium]|nr:ATP-binding protein [Defluviitaleaceae bacterium]